MEISKRFYRRTWEKGPVSNTYFERINPAKRIQYRDAEVNFRRIRGICIYFDYIFLPVTRCLIELDIRKIIYVS